MSNVGSQEARVEVEEVERIDVDEVDTPNTTDVPSNEVEEENSMKRRTTKRKSQVWNDFAMIENDDGTRKAVCNHCGMKFDKKWEDQHLH